MADHIASISITDALEELKQVVIDELYSRCCQKGCEFLAAMLLKEFLSCGKAIGQHRPEFFWMLEKLREIQTTVPDVSDEKLAECLRSMQKVYKSVSGMKLDTSEAKEQPKVFHHYTKSEVFRLLVPIPGDEPYSAGGEQKEIKKSNFLRLGNMEYVNDPHEGLALQEYCRGCNACRDHVWEQLADDDGLDNSISSKMFVLCFAGEENQLDHWRMYGPDGKGVSIGIPATEFQKPPVHLRAVSQSKTTEQLEPGLSSESQKPAEPKGHPLWTPMSVMYTDDAKGKACKALHEPLQKALELRKTLSVGEAQKIFTAAITGLLLPVLYRFKDKAYSSEDEWRTFVFEPDLTNAKIDENEDPHRVYLETEPELFEKPGYEVWIGPKVEDARKVRLEFEYRLACTKQAGNVDLNISKHHYR